VEEIIKYEIKIIKHELLQLTLPEFSRSPAPTASARSKNIIVQKELLRIILNPKIYVYLQKIYRVDAEATCSRRRQGAMELRVPSIK